MLQEIDLSSWKRKEREKEREKKQSKETFKMRITITVITLTLTWAPANSSFDFYFGFFASTEFGLISNVTGSHNIEKPQELICRCFCACYSRCINHWEQTMILKSFVTDWNSRSNFERCYSALNFSNPFYVFEANHDLCVADTRFDRHMWTTGPWPWPPTLWCHFNF